jgi:hypothetical protein
MCSLGNTTTQTSAEATAGMAGKLSAAIIAEVKRGEQRRYAPRTLGHRRASNSAMPSRMNASSSSLVIRLNSSTCALSTCLTSNRLSYQVQPSYAPPPITASLEVGRDLWRHFMGRPFSSLDDPTSDLDSAILL